MTQNPHLRMAAVVLVFTGVLPFLSPLFNGAWNQVSHLIGPLAVSVLLAWGIVTERRWVAYVAFLFLLFTMVMTAGNMAMPMGVPIWFFWIFLVAAIIGVVALFRYLWAARPAAV